MLGKLIDTLAPRLAADRAEAQLRLSLARARGAALHQVMGAPQRQGYSGAAAGGRFAGWQRPRSSANTEVQQALPLLRASARELVRNNPFAAKAVRTISAHVAGTGVRPGVALARLPEAGRREIVAACRAQWEQFSENCDPAGRHDFYGLQRLVMRAVVESGEALMLWRPREIGGRLRWRCEVLEGDYLDHMRNAELKNGGRIVQGVEFNRHGERVAYWLFRTHPGDRFGLGQLQDARRVPASFVDHVHEVMRPGQVRGIPWFAPAATTLHDIEGLAEAELVRKKLEACIGMVIKNANDEGDGATPALAAMSDDSGEVMRDAHGNLIERMQPGMILQARPGWDVEFNAPPASPGLGDHMRERLHAVAAGIGTTYAQLTGDLSQVNYSSTRAGTLEFERLVDGWQDDLMIMALGRPAWRRVIAAGQVNGRIPFETPIAAEWTRPKRPWVDPLKDAMATIREIEAGLESPQSAIARKGRDPMAVLDECRDWAEARAQRGLAPETGDQDA